MNFVRRYVPDASFDGEYGTLCWCGACVSASSDSVRRHWVYYDDDSNRYYATDAFFEDHPVWVSDPDTSTPEQINRVAEMIRGDEVTVEEINSAARIVRQREPVLWPIMANSWSIAGDVNTPEEPHR